MHNIGTVPTFKMHKAGTVPSMFKMHNVGTKKNYDLCLELEFYRDMSLVILSMFEVKVQFSDPHFCPKIKPFCMQIKGTSRIKFLKSGRNP